MCQAEFRSQAEYASRLCGSQSTRPHRAAAVGIKRLPSRSSGRNFNDLEVAVPSGRICETWTHIHLRSCKQISLCSSAQKPPKWWGESQTPSRKSNVLLAFRERKTLLREMLFSLMKSAATYRVCSYRDLKYAGAFLGCLSSPYLTAKTIQPFPMVAQEPLSNPSASLMSDC